MDFMNGSIPPAKNNAELRTRVFTYLLIIPASILITFFGLLLIIFVYSGGAEETGVLISLIVVFAIGCLMMYFGIRFYIRNKTYRLYNMILESNINIEDKGNLVRFLSKATGTPEIIVQKKLSDLMIKGYFKNSALLSQLSKDVFVSSQTRTF